MPALSAGILLYHRDGDVWQVLLVHPGGPFWRRRERRVWSIPKGGPAAGESTQATARREFEEELGHALAAPLMPLGSVRQSRGKIVEAFAAEGDLDVTTIRSNCFELEWPPGSGQHRAYPEVDRACWFTLTDARRMILPGQSPLLDRLEALLSGRAGAPCTPSAP